MLDKGNSPKLKSAVIERLSKKLSDDLAGNESTKALLRLAVLASAYTLEKYEDRHSKIPSQWYEENAEIWAPFQREKEDTYYQLDVEE